MDLLPVSGNEVLVSQEHVIMVRPGEEEKQFDQEQKIAEDVAGKCALSKRKTQSEYAKASTNAFVGMDPTSIKTAKSFTYRFRPNNSDTIEWTILEDGD